MSEATKLPDEIMVWRSSPCDGSWLGTWATTRYPPVAVAYVPAARVRGLEAEVARLTAELKWQTRVAEMAELAKDAAEAKLAQGVRVKPLVWRDVETHGGGVWDAVAAGVVYRIVRNLDGEYWLTDPRCETVTPTLIAAKAAAQYDYEARILATIDAVPAAQITDEALERAAKRRASFTLAFPVDGEIMQAWCLGFDTAVAAAKGER